LESESKLLFVCGSGGERVETLDEFEEGNGSVLVFIENSDDSFNEWIIGKLWNIKKFFWLKSSTLIFIKLRKVLFKDMQLRL